MNLGNRPWLMWGTLALLVIGTALLWLLPGKVQLSAGDPGTPIPAPVVSPAPSGGSAASATIRAEAAREQAAAPAISTADRARIDAEVQKCREICVAFERENAEDLSIGEKSRIIRVHPPNEAQLDRVHDAITKGAASFPANSGAEAQFREEALALIREFGIFESPGRLVGLSKPTSKREESLAIMEFADRNMTVTVEPDGKVSISAGTVTMRQLPDWSEPQSPSRRRYHHLFINP